MSEKSNQNKFKIKDILQVFLVLIFVFLFLKISVLDFAIVSSNSMKPTLVDGDHIVFSKVAYQIGIPSYVSLLGMKMKNPIAFQYKSPEMNDPLLFYKETKKDNYELFIKRVTGVPGDKVYIDRNNRAYPFSIRPKESSRAYLIPYKGSEVIINSENLIMYERPLREEGAKIEVKRGKIIINEDDNSYKFKNDYYFLQGDNFKNSVDSRHFGLISENDIVGKPLFVYMTDNKSYNSRVGEFIK